MRILRPWKGAFWLLALWGSLMLRPPVGAYDIDAPDREMTVQGRITFAGSPPKAEALPVYRDSKFCGETIPNESLTVEATSHGVAGVVVSLEGVANGKPVALQEDEPELGFENRICRFFPRTSAAAVGSTIGIKNSDPILHNTHIRKENRFGSTVLNVAQPAGTKMIKKPLRESGFMDIRCDAHPFMRATVLVFEHPYFAVTDATGRFELPRVPPGRYRLHTWHETLGTTERTISVTSEGPLSIDVELRQPER